MLKSLPFASCRTDFGSLFLTCHFITSWFTKQYWTTYMCRATILKMSAIRQNFNKKLEIVTERRGCWVETWWSKTQTWAQSNCNLVQVCTTKAIRSENKMLRTRGSSVWWALSCLVVRKSYLYRSKWLRLKSMKQIAIRSERGNESATTQKINGLLPENN